MPNNNLKGENKSQMSQYSLIYASGFGSVPVPSRADCLLGSESRVHKQSLAFLSNISRPSLALLYEVSWEALWSLGQECNIVTYLCRKDRQTDDSLIPWREEKNLWLYLCERCRMDVLRKVLSTYLEANQSWLFFAPQGQSKTSGWTMVFFNGIHVLITTTSVSYFKWPNW